MSEVKGSMLENTGLQFRNAIRSVYGYALCLLFGICALTITQKLQPG